MSEADGVDIAAIGLGSNMGDKRANIARAVAALAATPGVRVFARSGDYRTAPWGFEAQDWFVNACVLVATSLSPRALLLACLGIEESMGRRRDMRWGPRIIDLDVLFCGGHVVEEAGLVLPHPHIAERAFVLAPLAEIAPAARIGDISVADALARIGREGVERLQP